MYVEEAKCPYHRSCQQYIGGVACLNFNWEKMDCFKQRKKKDDDMKKLKEQIRSTIRINESEG